MNHKDEICWPHPWTVYVGLLYSPLLRHPSYDGDRPPPREIHMFVCWISGNGNAAMQFRNSNYPNHMQHILIMLYMICIYIYVIYKYTIIYLCICIYIYPLANTVDARNLAIQLIKCGSFITFVYTKTAAGVADVEWAWGERWDLAEESHQVSWVNI